MNLENILVSSIDNALNQNGLSDENGNDFDALYVKSAYSFGDAGLLTRDSGLVIQLSNGAEFQVTIKQSARPHGGVHCFECPEWFASDDECRDHLVREHGWNPDDVEEAYSR